MAAEKLTLAEKKLMQAAAKGTINKKSASRKISRLAKDSTLQKQLTKSHPSPPVYKLNTQARATKTMDVSPIVFSLPKIIRKD